MGGVKPQIWCPNFRRWGGMENFGQNPYFILFASCCRSIGWNFTLSRLEGSRQSMKYNMKFQSSVKSPKSWKYEGIYTSPHCVHLPLASPTHRGLCMLFIQEQYIGCQTLSLVHYNRNGVDIFQFEVITRLIYFSDQL